MNIGTAQLIVLIIALPAFTSTGNINTLGRDDYPTSYAHDIYNYKTLSEFVHELNNTESGAELHDFDPVDDSNRSIKVISRKPPGCSRSSIHKMSCRYLYGCPKRPSYGERWSLVPGNYLTVKTTGSLKDKLALYCADHKGAEHVDVRNRICGEALGCWCLIAFKVRERALEIPTLARQRPVGSIGRQAPTEVSSCNDK
eukprot:765147-Hanusia_phi.AAC.5